MTVIASAGARTNATTGAAQGAAKPIHQAIAGGSSGHRVRHAASSATRATAHTTINGAWVALHAAARTAVTPEPVIAISVLRRPAVVDDRSTGQSSLADRKAQLERGPGRFARAGSIGRHLVRGSKMRCSTQVTSTAVPSDQSRPNR